MERWPHTVSGACLCECVLSRYLCVTGLAVLLGVPGWRVRLCWHCVGVRELCVPVFVNLGVYDRGVSVCNLGLCVFVSVGPGVSVCVLHICVQLCVDVCDHDAICVC